MTSILLIVVGVVAAIATTTSVAPTATATKTEDFTTSIGSDTKFPVRKPGGWKVKTLDTLADVESFLDYLENQHIAERELVVVANDVFAVRWKSVA